MYVFVIDFIKWIFYEILDILFIVECIIVMS